MRTSHIALKVLQTFSEIKRENALKNGCWDSKQDKFEFTSHAQFLQE